MHGPQNIKNEAATSSLAKQTSVGPRKYKLLYTNWIIWFFFSIRLILWRVKFIIIICNDLVPHQSKHIVSLLVRPINECSVRKYVMVVYCENDGKCVYMVRGQNSLCSCS